jgi:uncharacterized protein DUF4383
MSKNLLWVFGVVFVLVGVLGFIPNPIVGHSMDALFMTNTLHDIVHLLFGVVMIWAAVSAPEKASTVFKVSGAIYLLLAVLGFLMIPSGGNLLGLVTMNMADHWLHVVLGVVILGAGFMVTPKRMNGMM